MSKTARSRIRIVVAGVVLAASTVVGTGVAEAKVADSKDAAAQISTRGFRNR
jgi:hypothetical protein